MFCSKCGKENSEESTFCVSCGKSLKEVPSSQNHKLNQPIHKQINRKKINPFLIVGLVLAILLIAVYFFFIKETPTAAGLKAAEMYYDLNKKYKEEIISGLISFNDNVFKTPKPFWSTSRLLARNNLSYCLNNPINGNELLENYLEEKRNKYKNNIDELNEFQSVYTHKMTEYHLKLSELDNIIEEKKDSAYKKINKIHPPYPDMQNIKAELLGKTFRQPNSSLRWTFVNFSDNTKNFTMTQLYYDDDQCHYEGSFTGGNVYMCFHVRFFLREAQISADVDRWVLDLQGTQIISCESD